jgi:hypothetical protein
MKNVVYNVLYRYHILLIVYSFISLSRILSQATSQNPITEGEVSMRTAMAEPLQTWKGSSVLSVVVLNIPVILYAAIRYYDDGGGGE